MNEKHLIVMSTLYYQVNIIKFCKPIDYNTIGYAFIAMDYDWHHNLPLQLQKSTGNLTIIDR
jgi:hypothetical protein